MYAIYRILATAFPLSTLGTVASKHREQTFRTNKSFDPCNLPAERWFQKDVKLICSGYRSLGFTGDLDGRAQSCHGTFQQLKIIACEGVLTRSI
jgi:hypothetical protein